MQYLTAYDWPGNVRELENTIERAVVLGASDHMMRDDLPDALLEAPASGEVERPRFHDAVREAKVRVIVDSVPRSAAQLHRHGTIARPAPELPAPADSRTWI